MTTLEALKSHWTEIGSEDPLFGVLTQPGKSRGRWGMDEFMATGRSDVERFLQIVRDSQVNLRTGRALDFGCGVGRLTQALCDVFEQVDGADISPSMLAVARRENRYAERCHYHETTSDTRLPFPDESFDFICTLITLQHMEPRFARLYLRDFCRLLKPGGVMLFQVPDQFLRPETVTRQPLVARVVRQLLAPVRSSERLMRRVVFADRYEESADSVARMMEMHCLPQQDVISTLSECGVRVVTTLTDNAAGEQFVSKRYVAVRQDTAVAR